MRIPETHAPPGHHGPTALVVVNGDDVFEDLFTAAAELQAVLTDEGFATRTGTGMGRFEHAVRDDLIVLCTALGEFTTGQRRGLREAVRAGAGLLAFHATNVPASASADPDEADRLLTELIGSRYVSHGPRPHESRFGVFPDPAHELTAGLAPFTVTHEHYALAVEDHAKVVAWRGPLDTTYAMDTTDATGGTDRAHPPHRTAGAHPPHHSAVAHTARDADSPHHTAGPHTARDTHGTTHSAPPPLVPLVHVSEFGRGRVCYVQLGHDMRVWAEPPVRDLIRRAARWVNRLTVQGVAS
ncbi:ThuA domain-containing protein [Streptomyces sp. 8L]|uniref:ThuA domain-containing protein n=1 Tax=Streptomyces sp. 8L TaxID=2877242 RepID=UPI001CD54019|nr:ThuA domain-containing protein [Streptomyces sp. 8L]MCA1218276.1 ThuA domain-containing protein [Streptomyces sp. 8L]